MSILERFLKYVKIDTTFDSNSNLFPSTINQKVLANLLIEELNKLNVDDIYYDEEYCYIYAKLKGDDSLPKVGFISHLDTSEDANGKHIKPNIIENHIGKSLITTDGTTLLGADDKAGIAEIMTMIDYYSDSNETHGDIYVCFTPDEEIGLGIEHFDLSKFDVDLVYTIDGSTLGEISYENFNAATANININGISTHCGTAKDKMINSILLANEINNELPYEIPANTEGYEGFYHLQKLEGTVENTKMEYLIRDFDRDKFCERKENLIEIIEKLNEKYNNCINLELKDSYYNMKMYLNEDFEGITNVKRAMGMIEITPIVCPIRGVTDGAHLTKKGIPCPNIGTGGHNFHSVREYICVEDMEKTSETLIGIVKEYSKKDNKIMTKTMQK